MSQSYSFLDVSAALVGPGANINLGSGAGTADEGLTLEMIDAKNTLTIGSDATPMNALHAGKGGRIRVTLLGTSPTNYLLTQAYNFQTSSGANHGQNTIVVTNLTLGDIFTLRQVAFNKLPSIKYGKDGAMREWMFDVGIVDMLMNASS